MNKPSIAIVTAYFPPVNGGMQWSNLQYCKLIHERHKNIKVFTPHTQHSEEDKKIDATLSFPVVRFSKWGKSSWSNVGPFCGLLKSFKKEDYQGIISLDDTVDKALGLFVPEIPYIVSTCGTRLKLNDKGLKRFLRNRILKNCYKHSTHIVCVSECTKQWIDEEVSGLQVPKTVIPFPVREEFLRPIEPMPFLEQELRFICVARLEKPKGLENIFSLLKNVKRKTKLTIVGISQSDFDQNYRNVPGNIEISIIPRLDSGDLAKAIDKNHIGILLSTYEDFRGYGEPMPSVMLETLARGRPFLGTDEGGFSEVINKSQAGFLWNKKDFHEIGKIINDFDLEKLKILGQNGRSWVEKNLKKEVLTDQWDTVIKESF